VIHDLSPQRLAELSKVFRSESAVVAAWLFGSVAQGRATPLSDVDFAVLLRPNSPQGLDRFVLLDRLANALADLLGISDQSIDVIPLNDQGVLFQHSVLRTGRLVYETDPRARALFVSSVLRRYFDFRPTVAIFDVASRRQRAAIPSVDSERRGSKDLAQ